MAKKTVLVVEDVELHQDFIVQAIENDYDVITAFSGDEGVHFAQQERPDLILIDISLPDINGCEATRKIRANPELRQVPVIALILRPLRADREKIWIEDFNDHLYKPIDKDQLIAIIEKHLD